jgi:phosphoglycerol transferase
MLPPMNSASGHAAVVGGRERFWPLGVTAAVVSAVIVIPVHRLWSASLRVPFSYEGDANSVAITVKGTLDHGWYWTNPNLGAPFKQHFVDYPFSDNVHIVIMRLMGLVFPDYPLVINLYYLLGYVMVAVAAAWAMHRLGLSRAAALAAAVLYSFLPYHQTRGEGHLFLGNYFIVPIACYLILRSLKAAPLLDKKLVTKRNALVIAACLLVGATTAYYAVFAILLLLLVGVVQLWQDRNFRRLTSTAFIVGAIALSFGVNAAPTVLYHARHGGNAAIAHDKVSDTEAQGLKVAAMLLPRENHRVSVLDKINRKYRDGSPVESELGQSFGAVGAAGLLVLLSLAVIGPFRRRPATHLEKQLQPLAALSVGAILLATVGGLSSLIAFVAPAVRGWNRISVFIAFFTFFALGLLADHVRRASRTPAALRRAFPVLLALVVVVGVFDQTRNPPPYGPTKAAFASDETFVKGIEKRLGRDAMVFQLPYNKFPESPGSVDMAYYDEARGYLHSDTLRWSWGGVKGRPQQDWQKPFLDERTPVPDMVDTIAAVGFTGIYIDRFGYEDRGAAIEAAIQQLAPQQPLVSPNGRLVLYDIRSYATKLQSDNPQRFQQLRNKVLRLPES